MSLTLRDSLEALVVIGVVYAAARLAMGAELDVLMRWGLVLMLVDWAMEETGGIIARIASR